MTRYKTETFAEALERVPALAELRGENTGEAMGRVFELVDTLPGYSLVQMIHMAWREPVTFVFRRVDKCCAERAAAEFARVHMGEPYQADPECSAGRPSRGYGS